MSSPAKIPAKGRRYGFACLECRRRKIKCDGKKPKCTNCIKARDTCSYKEDPSLNTQLLHRLHESRKRVHHLETTLRELISLGAEHRGRKLDEIARDLNYSNVAEPWPDRTADITQNEYEADKESSSGESPSVTFGEHGTVRLPTASSFLILRLLLFFFSFFFFDSKSENSTVLMIFMTLVPWRNVKVPPTCFNWRQYCPWNRHGEPGAHGRRGIPPEVACIKFQIPGIPGESCFD